MTATFAPRPGAAPLARQVAAQARMEARLLLRNGEQLLLAVVIPVIVLVGGVAAAGRLGSTFEGHAPVDLLTPGVLALAVMSTAFTSVAIATGFERRYGVIKLLGSSPLPRHGLLLGKVLALLNVVALQLVVLVVVALALGWEPSLASPPTTVIGLVLTVGLGTAAFASLGLLVAGALRVLTDWPHQAGAVALALTGLIPVALILGTLPTMVARVDRLLTRTVEIAGLTAVVTVRLVAGGHLGVSSALARPSLSPDGLVAQAASRAGWGYERLIEEILGEAWLRQKTQRAERPSQMI